MHVYADDVLVTFGSAQRIGDKNQQWCGIFLNCNQLLEAWKVVGGAFITATCLNIVLRSPEYSARAARTIRSILFLIYEVACSLLPGQSQQIPRLAREIVNLKGRLAFLWNTERTRRERRGGKQSPLSEAKLRLWE